MPLDATTVSLLPEHVDLSIVLTFSGLGALLFTAFGALLGFDQDRLRRVVLLGSLVGGTAGVVWFLVLLGGAIR